MVKSRCLGPVVLVLTAAAAMSLPVFASGGGRPSVKVSPGEVRIGGAVTITAQHLPSRQFFTLLLAIPDAVHAKSRALIPQLGKSDARGSLRMNIRLPLLPTCGPASIYFSRGTAVVARARFTLTGCKAPRHAPPPPAPPGGTKHRKKPRPQSTAII